MLIIKGNTSIFWETKRIDAFGKHKHLLGNQKGSMCLSLYTAQASFGKPKGVDVFIIEGDTSIFWETKGGRCVYSLKGITATNS